MCIKKESGKGNNMHISSIHITKGGLLSLKKSHKRMRICYEELKYVSITMTFFEYMNQEGLY